MIFGNIQHVDEILPWLPAPLKRALSHLKSTDFGSLAAGTYELEGRDIYVMVVDLTTKPAAETRPEVHRAYLDVQFVWSGCERIGVAPDTGRNPVAEDLLAERDLLFYGSTENESLIDLHAGDFAVLFPSDVHRPAGQVAGPTAVRKVVVKIRAALLA